MANFLQLLEGKGGGGGGGGFVCDGFLPQIIVPEILTWLIAIS